jgi:hypothetical protein
MSCIQRRSLVRSGAHALALAFSAAAIATPVTPMPKSTERLTPPVLDLNALGLFERVYYQATRDGTIYAKGSNFKAQFTSAGLMYCPLGGKAMTFSLMDAMVGSQHLALGDAAVPTRDGDTISIDRGAFVEHYELTHDSIEQLFTIEQLPEHGNLVLRIAADAPEMISSTTSAGVDFKGDQTDVMYSKAVLVDATGATTPLSTKLVNGVIEIRVSSSALDRAAFPITIDPVISNSTPFTYLPYSYSKPDLAYDPTNNRFILVAEFHYAEDDHDIYSILLNGFGVPIPGTFAYVDLTGVNWRNPKVASNNIAKNFMVVAEHGLDGERGIWGNTVDPATGTHGTQFPVVAYDGKEKFNPDIGGDSHLTPPTHFLVVCESVFSDADHDIFMRLMNANGTPAGDATALDFASTNQSNPTVSKSNRGAQWAVVWQSNIAANNENIWGAKVNWNGNIIVPAQVINGGPESHKRPQVSSPMANQYLIAYEEGWTIHLQLVNSNLGTVDISSLVDLGNDTFSQPRLYPTVDADGSKFVIGYAEMYDGQYFGDWDLYADSICVDNGALQLAEYHRTLTATGNPDVQVTVATSWSAGGAAMGPAVFAWNETAGSDSGQIAVGGYDAPTSCCPADISPMGGDGFITVDDLLIVINQWENTFWCTNCAGDINGDTLVNVDDLLQVINAWGACQ